VVATTNPVEFEGTFPLQKARKQGLSWQASRTPAEIGAALTEVLPEEGETIQLVTAGYEEARYGPAEPSREKLRHFERDRRILQKKLDLSVRKPDSRGKVVKGD